MHFHLRLMPYQVTLVIVIETVEGRSHTDAFGFAVVSNPSKPIARGQYHKVLLHTTYRIS